MNYSSYLLVLFLVLFSDTQMDFVSFNEEDAQWEKINNEVEIILPFKIKAGYHIQAEKDVPENIIPTEFSIQENEGFELLDQQFLIREYDTVILDKVIHKVLSDEFQVKLLIKPYSLDKTLNLKGVLNYQACDDRQCFYPRKLDFQIQI